MDQRPQAPQQETRLPIPRWEFIALCAALMALNALAIDIMLPGLQQIGAALGVENPNHRQYVITAYIIAFGVAQLGFGPISDRFGRRGPLLIEGELTAKSSGESAYGEGARVFHVKFGPGSVASVDGNKLTVDFDKAGRKMVLDSFVQKAG